MMTVTKNILLAHGRAVQVLRKNCPDAKVGIAPTGDCCLPKDGSPEEVEKAQAKSLSHYPGYIMSNTWWADPVFWGRYPEWARGEVWGYYPTLQRTVKDSGWWYRDVIAGNGSNL